MTEIGITSLILIIANIFCSVQGLNDPVSFKRNTFEINGFFIKENYRSLVTSGFFHVSRVHLIVNLASLCFFSAGIELQLGAEKYLLIYFAGLVGGNLFALCVHRNHGNYCTVGATGAITAIIFATIVLFPGFQISFFGIHIPVPAWFYGLFYVLFSMYWIKSKRSHIGHEANLAGGLSGMLIAVMIQPGLVANNYLTMLELVVPSMFFIFIIISNPGLMLLDDRFFNRFEKDKVELIVQTENVNQQEIDLILEKIHQKGIGSLSNKEKQKLDYYSRILQ
ncbi:MAG: rhomboid family intramembrane serine protease [Ferruginibacter sp.]